MIQILHGEAESIPYPDDHFDCLVTDPPYGYGFMGKDWDKAVVGVETWKEILRVMKPGSFGFVMSAPRQDVLSRMIINLQDAGFETGFTSIYWAYATGFPKAMNISKAMNKKNEREMAGLFKSFVSDTIQAQALEGTYAGFQPKPAVEVILVVMKPLSEKGYLDQAMKDGKGVTWLDDGRIPYEGEAPEIGKPSWGGPHKKISFMRDGPTVERTAPNPAGRFPANLLVSDDVLDDGRVTRSGQNCIRRQPGKFLEHYLGGEGMPQVSHDDTGNFSRYFNLDVWWEALPESVRQTYPFLIVPKASKTEKNQGTWGKEVYQDESRHDKEAIGCNNPRNRSGTPKRGNHHPTVKPVKLMSYLIAIGSRPGDLILDPFMGSGTTLVAAKAMRRMAVGMDNDPTCIPIAEARVKAVVGGLF